MATGNKGNVRSGRVKGAPAKPALRWTEDPEILGRLQIVRDGMCRGKQFTKIRDEVNAWLAENDYPTIQLSTVYVDRQRVFEQLEEERQAMAEQEGARRSLYLARYQNILDKATEAFEETGAVSMNRSAYLSVASMTIERMSKLEGLTGEEMVISIPTLEKMLVKLEAEATKNGIDLSDLGPRP